MKASKEVYERELKNIKEARKDIIEQEKKDNQRKTDKGL